MRLLSNARIAVFGLIPFLALSHLACGILDDGQETDPYRIGVMESLTGPGETYGTVANQAKQMAADEINAAGGIDGRMLELVVEDSKCGAQDAIAGIQQADRRGRGEDNSRYLVQRRDARCGAACGRGWNNPVFRTGEQS